MAAENFVVAPEYLSIYVAGKRKISPPIDLDYGGIAANDDCMKASANLQRWRFGESDKTSSSFPAA